MEKGPGVRVERPMTSRKRGCRKSWLAVSRERVKVWAVGKWRKKLGRIQTSQVVLTCTGTCDWPAFIGF